MESNNKEVAVTEFIAKVIKNQDSRIEVVKRSHLLFFCTYFSDHLEYEMADFHKEMFRMTEDESKKLTVVTAFRGSGKSTIMNMSYVLWSVLGVQQKKFILIVSKTQEQAKTHFANIKTELETNELLMRDLGPFQEDFTWNNGALIIPRYNAKIIAISQDQKVRGLKFGKNRPDLIICDDIEDSSSVKTTEIRDKVYKWFNDEILTLGTNKTKTVVIGNLLHHDSLIKRLEMQIESNERDGVYRQYPITDEDKKLYWPGRFPNIEAIDAERKRIGDKFTWYREFLLIILDERQPVIEESWLKTYTEIPPLLRNQGYAYAIGVDPAFSENRKADNTGMVCCKIIGSGKDKIIYILPNPINEKFQQPATLKKIKGLVDSFEEKSNYMVYVEEVAAQVGLVQQLKEDDYKAHGVKVGQQDKRSRLSHTATPIIEGKILFPEKGVEELRYQMTNFGSTRYDDLVDAFTTLIIGIHEDPPHTFTGRIVIINNLYDGCGVPNDTSGSGYGMGSGWSVELGQDGQFHRRY